MVNGDTLDPPPEDEETERRRRATITIADLVRWYKDHGLSLDVPLSPYRRRVDRGDR